MTHDPFRGYDAWKTASPYDDDRACEVCEQGADDCECPLCPVCQAYGDPKCYRDHDLANRLKAAREIAKRENLDLAVVLDCFAEFLQLPDDIQARLIDYYAELDPTRAHDA